MSVIVVLAFFSPQRYKLPAQHLQTVVQTLHAQGVPIFVAQAVFGSQQSQPIPPAVQQVVFKVDSVLWLKECLWNAAAQMTDSDAFVFLDADIVFSTTAWLDRTLRQLEKHDIVQPYDVARWMSRVGEIEHQKRPATMALPDRDVPQMAKYHPGFAWAMRRDAWERLGGVYDRNACGGNDSAFFFALSNHRGAARYIEYFGRRQDRTVKSPSWDGYRKNAQQLGLSFGTTPGVTVTHLWHGDRRNRQYHTREASFRRNKEGEFDLYRNGDGLWQWTNPQDAKAAEKYFAARREDG
jgi:hypothetical protein